METFTLASGEVMTRAPGERYWQCNGKGRYWRHGDTFVRVGRRAARRPTGSPRASAAASSL